MQDAVVVEREPVEILFRRVPDDQAGISRGWAEVEAAVGSLRGRKFYGVVGPETGAYLVCVQRREGDDPAALGLEEGTLAGGRYARVRLEGDPPGVYERIAPAFRKLAERPDRDLGRPEVEFYRRVDVIDLLLPVR